MRLFISILIAASLSVPAAGHAQRTADTVAIRQAALDYAQGWYTADAARMERAVHPELAKRRVATDERGRSRLTQMSALSLVQGTGDEGGRDTPADRRRAEVRILDLFQDAASVRVDMDGWIDYMHLARWNGRWVIVNVLWEVRREGAR